MNDFTRLILFGLILTCIGQACTERRLTPKEYANYVKDPKNGLIKRCSTTAGVYLEAFYQPPTYTALIQLKRSAMTSALLSEQIEKNNAFHHFMLTIGSTDNLPIHEALTSLKRDTKPLSKKIQHLQYTAQPNFYLLSSRDSIPCAFYHVQSSGSIDNQYHILLAFENKGSQFDQNQEERFTLIFNDSVWFDQKFAFEFDKNKLQQSPKLKI